MLLKIERNDHDPTNSIWNLLTSQHHLSIAQLSNHVVKLHEHAHQYRMEE